jgi:hypothetical protein
VGGAESRKQKSNHLAPNGLAFRCKLSIAVWTGSRARRAFGSSPAGQFA